jgi:hypothetical protein
MDIGNVKNPYFDFPKIPIQDAQPLLNAMEIMSNDLQKQPPIYQNQVFETFKLNKSLFKLSHR